MSEDAFVIDQFADDLRARIDSGEYGNSGTLPSTTELSERWGKPRGIVTQVMLLLRSEGYIRMVRNRYVVNRPRIILPGLVKDFEQFLVDQGYPAEIDNLVQPQLETMPADVAVLFGQPAGIHVVHRMRKQGIPGQPLRVGEMWYPAKLAESFLEDMKRDDRMNVVNAIKEKFGVYIVRTKEEIVARIPTKQEIGWLSLARYQPVIEVRRANFTQDDQPIMFNRIIMVATNFVLSREYPVDHWK